MSATTQPSNLRRRKHQPDDDDDSLTEALLPPSLEEDDSPKPSKQNQLILHPGEFSVEKFIECLVRTWQQLVALIRSYLTTVVGAGQAEIEMSPAQAERLADLRQKAGVLWDSTDVIHQEALKKLWTYAFPDVPWQQLKTPKWKDMGWQGEDPGTDFRGAGLFGLQNLLYMADTYPTLFTELLHKMEGQRSDWEYPFAVAGLNITFMLLEVVEGGKTAVGAPRSVAGRSFLPLLEQDVHAFEEVYCVTYELLDRTWLEMRASYMEFNAVMKAVRAKVERALATHPAGVQQLRHALI